jgi:predicted nucleic acid-binding protein
VIVLDAYAVIAYLRAEPAAAEVRPLLTAGSCRLTAVGVAEVLDHLVRLAGADEESAALDLAQLDLLEGIAVDAGLGLAAGRLRARRYHRSRCAVTMADCIAAEAARHAAADLATSDPHLLDLCHAEGISTAVLTASDGTRWAPAAHTPGASRRRQVP